jgi:hypothetical protein
MIGENEIISRSNAVKYHRIEYCDTYVVITQNRTRRRVYNGYYFEDTGSHIYISSYYSSAFQHAQKVKNFIVNTVTKEWREYKMITVEKHFPDIKKPLKENIHNELIK